MIYFAAFVAATASALAITPAVARWATRRGAFCPPDPGRRRIHSAPIPRLGGIAVAGSAAASLVVVALLTPITELTGHGGWHYLVGLAVGAGLVLVAGAWDDHQELRASVKFGVQLLAAGVVYAAGFRIEVLSLPGADGASLGWLSLPLTLLWIIGITNAFNLIDGLDGLASGVALLALLATAAVAIAMGHTEVTLMALAVSGALLGFLRYNFNPARIFLGDSGSLFVGFMLAVLSVHGSMKSTAGVLAVVPLLLVAVPLLDTSVAIARRWLRGMSMSDPDRRHIHHQLLRLGLTQRKAVGVLYAAAAGLAAAAVGIAFSPSDHLFAITLVAALGCVVLVVSGMRGLGYHEFTEAGAAALSAVRKARRVIQDRIHARDLSPVIEFAESFAEVNAVLADNAEHFCFARMEVCRSSAPRAWRQDARLRSAFVLDFPLHEDAERGDPFVLRIWCDASGGSRPHGAERVARILAPVLAAKTVGWTDVEPLAQPALEFLSVADRRHQVRVS